MRVLVLWHWSLMRFILVTILSLLITIPTAHATDRSLARPDRGAYASPIKAASRIPDHIRPFAACVLKRESGGTLDKPQSGSGARNPNSSASGRWQALDGSGWREGGAWLVWKRLRSVGMSNDEAHEIRLYLSKTPIYKWHGLFQDAMFVQSVLEGGWENWRNNDRCDRLAVR